MSQRLRVLLVTDWMPRPGGAETYAESVRAGLTAAGDDVRLLTSGAGSAAHGTADFIAYGTTRRTAQVALQIVNPFATHQAWAAVRSFQPDVALVHLFAYHLSPAVLWPLRSVPTVMMVLDYKIICPLGSKLLPTGEICEQHAGTICWRTGCLSLPHWLRDAIRYVAIGRVIRQPHLVLACSRHMQRALEAHGIASEPLALPVAGPGRAFQRKPSRDPHFVFCGRLSVEKGVPLLVRAFARLRQQMPLARLTIVGDGPLRNEVESTVLARDLHDAVTFTGWLDPPGVDRQLATAWALVAPSVWAEPLGLVGPEAVIRSVPVIASSTGGFAETIEDEVSGLLFPNGDELALYRALERVATGTAFPSHLLDPDVVARVTRSFSVEWHIANLRARLCDVVDRAGT
jgi:glycosyltransferase involved in cell wall biosynthesis